MASLHTYTWQTYDDLWQVAANYMEQAGYQDVYSAVIAIRAANLGQGTANVYDWQSPSLVGTTIVIPFVSS